jgi:hypothetical protein
MGVTEINFDALMGGAGGPDTDLPELNADGVRPSVLPGGMVVNQLT